jgi:hypothetical protein
MLTTLYVLWFQDWNLENLEIFKAQITKSETSAKNGDGWAGEYAYGVIGANVRNNSGTF